MTVQRGTEVPEFELPNVAAGADPFSLSALPDDVSFAVLFFQRDHYCTNCRQQVQNLDTKIQEFHDRDAEVVSIVPEPEDRVANWQAEYDLSFPLLSDADAAVGAAYDQPVRFGVLGRFSDFLGRMPEVVIVDRRGDDPEVAYVHRGSSTFDRPDLADLLDELDTLCATDSSETDQ
jgi:peroxiredoxin Q/BCP